MLRKTRATGSTRGMARPRFQKNSRWLNVKWDAATLRPRTGDAQWPQRLCLRYTKDIDYDTRAFISGQYKLLFVVGRRLHPAVSTCRNLCCPRRMWLIKIIQLYSIHCNGHSYCDNRSVLTCFKTNPCVQGMAGGPIHWHPQELSAGQLDCQTRPLPLHHTAQGQRQHPRRKVKGESAPCNL